MTSGHGPYIAWQRCPLRWALKVTGDFQRLRWENRRKRQSGKERLDTDQKTKFGNIFLYNWPKDRVSKMEC